MLLIGNGVNPDAANDIGDAPYHPNVYVPDALRDDSVPPERGKRIVVQVHDETLRSDSSQPELPTMAHHAKQYQALLGANPLTTFVVLGKYAMYARCTAPVEQ